MTTSSNSVVERFLFQDCLLEELKRLEEGIEIVINHKTYFIQARLLKLVMDLKEMESTIRLSCVNTLYGCPLCGMHGKYIGSNNKYRSY